MAAWTAALLALAQDPAAAGAAYRDGLEALWRGRPQAAAERFREALAHVQEETPALFWRDREGRQRVAYHPHFMRARALLAQGGRDEEAVAHLERSRHPDAERVLRDLGAPPPESPVEAARRRWVEELCADGRFEEALKAAEADLALSDRVRVRRGKALDVHAEALAEALPRLSDVDPLRRPEAWAELLRPARVPPALQAHPEPALRWARRFADLVEREAPRLRRAASLEIGASLATAAAFDDAAEEARKAGCPEGVRAARRAAHAVRLARLEAASMSDADARILLEAAEASVKRALALDLPERDVRAFADRVAARRRASDALRAEVVRARAATEALRDPDRMADPRALEEASAAVEPVGDAPAPVRARMLLQRALLEATRLFLEGEPDEAVAERCGPAIAEALALDPRAAEALEGLSPRLRALLPAAK